jgi:hypothetical protein
MFSCSQCTEEQFESGISSECLECRVSECMECIDENGTCGPCYFNL